MGAIVALIFIYIVIAYVIVPLVSWIWRTFGRTVTIIAAVVGLGYGGVMAIYHYFRSLKANWNPYKYYVDRAKNPQPARRSYFFGPGYQQLKKTIHDAWFGIALTAKGLLHLMTGNGFLLGVLFAVFVVPALMSLIVAGGAITAALSGVHIVVLMIIMIATYIVFSVTWLVDAIYLRFRRIAVICPHCKRRFLMATYVCPKCGAQHTRLVPGPYGILHRRCNCGNVMPTAFLSGRSSLPAICPFPDCHHELASTSARQIGFQLVGGKSAGKTVLLAALYHEIRSRISANPVVDMRIPPFAEKNFEELDRIFEGAIAPPTLDMEANMNPMLFTTRASDQEWQLSLYDVAGEIFSDSHAQERVEEHFKYCGGLLLLIDPFSNAGYRAQVESEYGRVINYSTEMSDNVVENLATMVGKIKHLKHGRKIDTPVAVVITKADVGDIRRRVGYPKINAEYRANKGLYADRAAARDALCKAFLQEIGFDTTLERIEASFTNVHYFPLSAMGHDPDGEELDPWGVLQPIDWLLSIDQPEFAEALGIDMEN